MMFFAVLLTALMLAVIFTDISRFIIPNWLVGIVLVLYPVLIMRSAMHIEWQTALIISFCTFAVGFALFVTNIMGAGDIKLLAALALWVNKSAFAEFIMGMGLFGGLLAVILLMLRPFTAYLFSKLEKPPAIPKVLTVGEPVPYGVAIAAAFLLLLWKGDIPGVTF